MVCVKNVQKQYLTIYRKNILMDNNFFKLTKNFPKLYFWIFIITILLFFDQISKWLIRNNFKMFESKQLTSFLALTYTTNTGVAFGMFEGNNKFFIVSTIIILLILILSIDTIEQDFGKSSIYSVILIVSGGIGNLLDRIFFGKVTDFIDFQIKNKNVWPIFNFADSYVFVGVWILIISFIIKAIKLRTKKEILK